MKDVYEVLRQKEKDLTRVRHEVEALLYVAPLLSEQREDQPQIRESCARRENPPDDKSEMRSLAS